MTYDRPGIDTMTEGELVAIAREVVRLDAAAFSEDAAAAVATFNRRVGLLEELLGRATALHRSGVRVDAALARTIRLAASALRARRARLLAAARTGTR